MYLQNFAALQFCSLMKTLNIFSVEYMKVESKQITIAFKFHELFTSPGCHVVVLARLVYLFISRKQISIGKISKTKLIY